MMPVRIVIMAKAPVAGFAKTRLIPALGAEGAARLAQKMLRLSSHSLRLFLNPSPMGPFLGIKASTLTQ